MKFTPAARVCTSVTRTGNGVGLLAPLEDFRAAVVGDDDCMHVPVLHRRSIIDTHEHRRRREDDDRRDRRAEGPARGGGLDPAPCGVRAGRPPHCCSRWARRVSASPSSAVRAASWATVWCATRATAQAVVEAVDGLTLADEVEPRTGVDGDGQAVALAQDGGLGGPPAPIPQGAQHRRARLTVGDEGLRHCVV